MPRKGTRPHQVPFDGPRWADDQLKKPHVKNRAQLSYMCYGKDENPNRRFATDLLQGRGNTDTFFYRIVNNYYKGDPAPMFEYMTDDSGRELVRELIFLRKLKGTSAEKPYTEFTDKMRKRVLKNPEFIKRLIEFVEDE